jgi:lysophospholipase L1-like esterase
VITDVAAQVTKVNKLKADYVTLVIGGNDVWEWSRDYAGYEKAYLSSMKRYLDSMVVANQNVRILLGAIPDLTQVWSLSKDEASCQKVWRAIPRFCSPVFGASATDSSRIAFKAHVTQTNARLAELARTYPKNVKFAASVGTAKLARSDMSPFDCFHPSVSGQNTLSQYTWNEGWFAEGP